MQEVIDETDPFIRPSPGKRVNEFSMIEDQKYILNEILRIIDKEAPDGVLLAGIFMTDRFRLRKPCSF